jgi:hypothetical protein
MSSSAHIHQIHSYITSLLYSLPMRIQGPSSDCSALATREHVHKCIRVSVCPDVQCKSQLGTLTTKSNQSSAPARPMIIMNAGRWLLLFLCSAINDQPYSYHGLLGLGFRVYPPTSNCTHHTASADGVVECLRMAGGPESGPAAARSSSTLTPTVGPTPPPASLMPQARSK